MKVLNNNKLDTRTYKYSFKFENGAQETIIIEVENSTLNIIRKNNDTPQEWAKLKNFRCPNCPLPESVEYCPLAVNLSDLIGKFGNFFSYDKVDLLISTEEREYSKITTMQTAVSSLMGVLMVSSGCPIMGMLKPMVKFHLPFSTLEETQYRVLSMYLLAQYFKHKNGIEPDWDMKKLSDIYREIRTVNLHISKKILSQGRKDACVNSVVILNNFADYISLNLDDNALQEVEILFKDYLT